MGYCASDGPPSVSQCRWDKRRRNPLPSLCRALRERWAPRAHLLWEGVGPHVTSRCHEHGCSWYLLLPCTSRGCNIVLVTKPKGDGSYKTSGGKRVHSLGRETCHHFERWAPRRGSPSATAEEALFMAPAAGHTLLEAKSAPWAGSSRPRMGFPRKSLAEVPLDLRSLVKVSLVRSTWESLSWTVLEAPQVVGGPLFWN